MKGTTVLTYVALTERLGDGPNSPIEAMGANPDTSHGDLEANTSQSKTEKSPSRAVLPFPNFCESWEEISLR